MLIFICLQLFETNKSIKIFKIFNIKTNIL